MRAAWGCLTVSSLRNRTAILTALAAAFVLSIAGCGSAGSGKGSAPRTKPPAVNHQANLAPQESLGLASQLVHIPGYSYVDPSVSEVNYLVERIRQMEKRLGVPGFIAAQSYHAVVAADASQNKSHTASGGSEVGFLALQAYSKPPPASLTDDETYFSDQHGGKAPITRLEISGTPVYVFEYPDMPNSRFQYSWLRHGILANFDGAARGPLERWLNLYLAAPNPAPGETAQPHTARAGEPALTAVPGYEYANLRTKEARAMKKMIKASPDRLKAGSAHMILNEGMQPIAVIFLVETRYPDLPQVEQNVLRGMAEGQAPAGMHMSWKTIHSEKVMVAKSSSNAVYGWYHSNVITTVSGDNSSDVRDFVEAFLQAVHAP